jgi:hypothetical protein
MTNSFRLVVVMTTTVLTTLLSRPQTAAAQNLGPFRQLLAIEPYYTRLELDQATVPSTTCSFATARSVE